MLLFDALIFMFYTCVGVAPVTARQRRVFARFTVGGEL